MGKARMTPKQIVRIRARNRCEKCRVILTRNTHGTPDGDTARSLHHRRPRRNGGRDSVTCLVNLCISCHREIHADEKKAALEGWIVIDRDPALAPFLSWRGWVLPDPEGGLTLLNFETGTSTTVSELERPSPYRKPRRRVATRPQYDRRKKSSRKVA